MDDILVTIPAEVENLHLPSPELITYYKNLKNRIIWLDSEVSIDTLEIIRLIMGWNADDVNTPINERKPIKILIFSGGGSSDINDSLVDVIKLSSTPVYGYNMGCAFSAACYIFMSCHKKYSLPSATFLIHTGSATNISGTYEQVVSFIIEYQRKTEILAKFILDNSTISPEILEENISTEWYISAKEAIEYGFCDEIITGLDF